MFYENKMKEKNFQTKFGHWVKYNWYREGGLTTPVCAAFELKITKTNRFAFSQIEDHQVKNLCAVDNGLFFYKISDQSMGQKPFDCFSLGGPAYIVVLFYKPRVKSYFYLIDIRDIIKLSKKQKSITEEEAKAIAFKFDLLK